MTRKRLTDMGEAEFEQLMDNYIERTASGQSEIPASLFFDLLLERMGHQTEETVNLSIDVVNDDLVIIPDRETSDIVVRGNEIFIGKHHLVLRLADPV